MSLIIKHKRNNSWRNFLIVLALPVALFLSYRGYIEYLKVSASYDLTVKTIEDSDEVNQKLPEITDYNLIYGEIKEESARFFFIVNGLDSNKLEADVILEVSTFRDKDSIWHSGGIRGDLYAFQEIVDTLKQLPIQNW